MGEVVREVQTLGTFDLITVHCPARLLPAGSETHYGVFLSLFPHLRRGGIYVLRRAAEDGEDGTLLPPEWQHMLELLSRRVVPTEAVHYRELAVAQSIGGLVLPGEYLLVTSKRRQLLKVSESEVETILPTRGNQAPDDRVGAPASRIIRASPRAALVWPRGW